MNSIRSYKKVLPVQKVGLNKLYVKFTCLSNVAYQNYKEYDDIPQVKGYPLIKALPDYIKAGKQNIHKIWEQRMRDYGPIYRESFPFQKEIVFTSNPEDFKTIFDDEVNGPLFDRNKFQWALQEFSKINNLPPSLGFTSEKDFKKRRDAIKNSIILPKKVGKLTSLYDAATKDFFNELDERKDSRNIIKELRHLVFLWSMECAGLTLFHERFNVFTKDATVDESMQKLVDGRNDFLEIWCDLEMDLEIINRYFPNKKWDRFEKALSSTYKGMEELCSKYEQQAVDEELCSSEKEVVGNCVDILNGAIETTAGTAMWSLIEMSQYVNVQDKIYEEVKHVIPDGSIDFKSLQRLPYTKACLKELFRLRPLFLSTARFLNNDLVLSGYLVPKGTLVQLQTGLTDIHYPVSNHKEFHPERWMKTGENTTIEKPHTFHIVPFGHGPRACMGRSLAETLLYLFYANLFSKYRLHRLTDDEIKTRFGFAIYPEGEVNIVFEKRNDLSSQ